jgi:hypothetical protein
MGSRKLRVVVDAGNVPTFREAASILLPSSLWVSAMWGARASRQWTLYPGNSFRKNPIAQTENRAAALIPSERPRGAWRLNRGEGMKIGIDMGATSGGSSALSISSFAGDRLLVRGQYGVSASASAAPSARNSAQWVQYVIDPKAISLPSPTGSADGGRRAPDRTHPHRRTYPQHRGSAVLNLEGLEQQMRAAAFRGMFDDHDIGIRAGGRRRVQLSRRLPTSPRLPARCGVYGRGRVGCRRHLRALAKLARTYATSKPDRPSSTSGRASRWVVPVESSAIWTGPGGVFRMRRRCCYHGTPKRPPVGKPG